jgi:hypothetical protein
MHSPRRQVAPRRILIGVLGLLVMLAAAHTGLWWFATTRLMDAFANWQAQCRAAGWTVSAGQPARAGWPLAAAIDLPDIQLSGGESDLPGGLSWRAARAEVSLALLQPRLLSVRLAGEQRLRLSELPPFAFTATEFELTAPLASTPVASAGLAASGLRVSLPTGPLDVATLAAEGTLRPDAGKAEDAMTLTGSAEAIGVPPAPDGRPWPLGPRLASVSFDAALSGPLPSAPDLTTRATAWRDDGGRLVVHRLALGWGPLGLSGSATMALDEHMQPTTAATVRLVGYDATLDALASAGAITQHAALAAKAVLALLARRPDGGGAPTVELPLTLEDGTLSAGRFPLLRLPRFVWP